MIRGHIEANAPGNWMAAIRAEIDHEMSTTLMLPTERIVKPATLLIIDQYRRFLEELLALVEVHECKAQGETDVTKMCRLVILSGGPGKPLKQKETFGPIFIRLISATEDAVAINKASCVVLDESDEEVNVGLKCHPVKKKDSVALEDISLDKGTKKALGWFQVNLELSTGAVMEVRIPEPFVVTTNENQWDASLGNVLCHQLFASGPLVSRSALCNAIQRVYLEGIREPNQADPKRPLSPADFSYMLLLRAIPEEATHVSVDQFRHLWQWFGVALSRIRHNQTVLEMWSCGYIMGFVTRESAEALLINERPGSFLLRFSSQAPGLFAIAYTSPDGASVKHYLMKKTDINVSYSLAKFLLEKPFFDTLLQTVPSFATEAQWQRVPKTKALENWATAKEVAVVPGYDETLNIPFQNMSIGNQ